MNVNNLSTNQRLLMESAKHFGIANLEELNYFPKHVSIENTSVCNARCVMCPVLEWKRDYKLMPDDIWQKILADLKPFADWVEHVYVPIIGEPLIDKGLEAKIRDLKKIGIKHVDLTCNASLMTEKRARSLLEAGLDAIDFSIDGATKETFEKIRIRLDYDVCRDNILSFLKTRDDMRPSVPVRVRMTVWEDNAHEFPAFRDFWKSVLGPIDQVYGKAIHNWGNWRSGLAPKNILTDEVLNGQPCLSTWFIFNIFSDGRVPLCCVDFNAKDQLGDVRTASLAEIWRGSAAQRVRDLHLQVGRSGMEKCKGCFAWEQSLRIT